MQSFFAEYGLFLAQFLTVLVLLGVAFVVVAAAVRRGGQQQGLTVTSLNKEYERAESIIKRAVQAKTRFKREAREKKKADKRKEKAADAEADAKPRTYVIDFKGDIRASATESLREEVNAVLAVAGPSDAVLLKLENAGGMVHEHGLAASQLARLKQRKIPLTVAVDKVAASGGYLMACIADRIIAAPFAIVGSIGVIAQLPNFHRWLEARGIDFEQVTAGRFKRTLTVFGENTQEGREKLGAELEEIHGLFKEQVSQNRPAIDLEEVATGEHWYALRALELGLVDEIKTSDDYLLEAAKAGDVYRVSYKRRKPVQEKVLSGAESLLSRIGLQ